MCDATTLSQHAVMTYLLRRNDSFSNRGCRLQQTVMREKNLRRKISNVESVAIFLNVLKRDRNVDHWSVYSNVTLCILHYCLCFLYYNFETLHCHYISNNIANNAKYQ